MPNTCVTPHATMVSAITSVAVRGGAARSGSRTYTPSARSSTSNVSTPSS